MSETDPDLSRPSRSLIVRAAPYVLGPIVLVLSVIFLRWVFRTGGPQEAVTALWVLPVTMLMSLIATVIMASILSGSASGEGAAGVAGLWSIGHVLTLCGGLIAVGIAFLSGGTYAGIYVVVLAIFAAFDGLMLLCLI